MDSKEILEAQYENRIRVASKPVDFKVGDWVTCEEFPVELHVIEIDDNWFKTDKFRGAGGTTVVENTWFNQVGNGWEFHSVTPVVETKPDTLDIKVFSVHRSAPSKGYEIALFPGAPFGPEVVLSLRERGELEVEVAVETPEDKPEFVSVIMGSVTVLLDWRTAAAISAALYQHGLAEAAAGEEVQS